MRLPQIVIFSAVMLSLSLLTGCGRSAGSGSESEILPREEMIQLMADLEVTEAALRYRQGRVSGDSLEVLKRRSFDSLYGWYGINPTLFNDNLAYYQRDLQDFEKMVAEVILQLERKKDSLLNLPPLEKVILPLDSSKVIE